MRKIGRTMAAAALCAGGLLVASPSPAMATPTAPYCDSGASQFYCDADPGFGPYTWTITFRYVTGNFTNTYTTSDSTIFLNCPNTAFGIWATYSYVSGGVTETSGQGGTLCRSGPWQ
jgi:hypothetical protein